MMLQENVGLFAINDLCYLESTVFALLRIHFRHLPYYTDLLDLFHEVSDITFIDVYFKVIIVIFIIIIIIIMCLKHYNVIAMVDELMEQERLNRKVFEQRF